jgi:D-lactate dehydrogenase (cytochrome)
VCPDIPLAECVQVTALDAAELNIPIALFGHVGDGNFHFVMMLDPDDARERQLAEDLSHRLIGRALDMEGTCSEEHDSGIGKAKYLVKEHSSEAVAVMAAIKSALDPLGLMNPGKILTE